MNYSSFLLMSSLTLLSFCDAPKNNFQSNTITQNMKQHVKILSSDDFLGRKPFTEGETKTVAYLEEQFKLAGLEPANGESYLQVVPMVSLLAKAANSMTVKTKKGSFSLKAFDDYILWTDKTEPNVEWKNLELVFAGYGVVAPEHNWNDYAGLDAKGKVVMVMVNDPGFWVNDSTLFKGEEMTYYGRWTYKFEEAARQGATGCLIIHNTRAASYPFSVQQNSFNTTRLNLDTRGSAIPHSDAIGWVTESTANRLFKAAGYDSTLLRNANIPGFKAISLGLKLSTTMTVESAYNKSFNVVGKITGSEFPDEYVIYSAHWDHLGVGKPDESGDDIYNGALDNATGTASLIELAKVFKASKPKRSVVFLAVTAEEQGLLGSQYYAENPLFPANKTLANINIDGLNRFDETSDIIVIGEGQSDLEELLAMEAQKVNRYISFDANKAAGYYYRSDHFNFAKIGIPALYTSTGIDVVGKGKEYGVALKKEYTEKSYHRPSDEFDAATWTLKGAVADMQVLYNVGLTVANATTWPQWKSGSEFKKIRDKSLMN